MVNNSYVQDISVIYGLISGISNPKILGNIWTISTLILKELQLPRELAFTAELNNALSNCSQSVVPGLLEGRQTGQAGRQEGKKEGRKEGHLCYADYFIKTKDFATINLHGWTNMIKPFSLSQIVNSQNNSSYYMIAVRAEGDYFYGQMHLLLWVNTSLGLAESFKYEICLCGGAG